MFSAQFCKHGPLDNIPMDGCYRHLPENFAVLKVVAPKRSSEVYYTKDVLLSGESQNKKGQYSWRINDLPADVAILLEFGDAISYLKRGS